MGLGLLGTLLLAKYSFVWYHAFKGVKNMNFFNQNQSGGAPLSGRKVLENKYANARTNILLVIGFTVINLILLVSNSSTYFLFSAYIPYVLVDLGMLLSGKYDGEYTAQLLEGMETIPQALPVMLVVAVVILALYALCWVFSKKFKKGWLITALVFFGVDSLVMLLLSGFMVESLIDYAFHAWVIVSLAMGISACGKMKKLPPEEEVPAPVMNFDPMTGEPIEK